MGEEAEAVVLGSTENEGRREGRTGRIPWLMLGVVTVFALGFLSGYLVKGGQEAASAEGEGRGESGGLVGQVIPIESYALPVSYRDLGPQLLDGGVIDLDTFRRIMAEGGHPIGAHEIDLLQKGGDETIVITRDNAHFLLNFFWAVGLANENAILTEGPMADYSGGRIENFASTGGWGISKRDISELFASLDLVPLTAEQQALVEEVASATYRPCCDNPTLFPDCNHGMAMLGLLEMMAAEGATADEMFEAAKYINAFWFPQQSLDIATYLQVSQGLEFDAVDPRLAVGQSLASASGAATVQSALDARGLLEDDSGQGGGCTS